MELLETLTKVDAAEKEVIVREATDIFSRCIDPRSSEPRQNTGLVVGYVQSGKTLSFTTVAALAHDNGFRMIIVITGTSVDLTDQSKDRLRHDLRLGTGRFRPWHHHHNPKVGEGVHQQIKRELAEWTDEAVPMKQKRTVLITVMKNHLHLSNLAEVLRHIELRGVPTLIIDDEADQAGLNNLIKESDESTTYQRLTKLRDLIPSHTFLQYTATPQGPLLISLIDVLSPDFAVVLTPGSQYIGGKDLFTGIAPLIRDIPEQEIASENNPLPEPPESLLEAMRIFFLGVASAYSNGDSLKGNRSMMVHPSARTVGHIQYHVWVQSSCDSWMSILESTSRNPTDPDRIDLLNEFKDAYNDLKDTVPGLESLDQLAKQLLRAMRDTKIVIINSLKISSEVRFGDNYSWILVGGQALDRGFTVEGLTVTYMPRGVGVGNADTIQQRARFFGYKKQYLGYCRVFLEPRLRSAFVRYIDHEEHIRYKIADHAAKGLPLTELRRAFLLDRTMKATRGSILERDYIRIKPSDWTTQDVPHEVPVAIQENRSLVDEFIQSLTLQPDAGHPDRTETQRHLVASGLPLREVFNNFLTRVRVPNLSDSQRLTGALIALDWHLIGHPDTTCTVYYMSSGKKRERGTTADGEISNLFQGAYPVAPKERQGEIYLGDRLLRGDDQVAIQIHRLNIKSGTSSDDPVIAEDVPVVAVWIDPEIAKDSIDQTTDSSETTA